MRNSYIQRVLEAGSVTVYAQVRHPLRGRPRGVRRPPGPGEIDAPQPEGSGAAAGTDAATPLTLDVNTTFEFKTLKHGLYDYTLQRNDDDAVVFSYVAKGDKRITGERIIMASTARADKDVLQHASRGLFSAILRDPRTVQCVSSIYAIEHTCEPAKTAAFEPRRAAPSSHGVFGILQTTFRRLCWTRPGAPGRAQDSCRMAGRAR